MTTKKPSEDKAVLESRMSAYAAMAFANLKSRAPGTRGLSWDPVCKKFVAVVSQHSGNWVPAEAAAVLETKTDGEVSFRHPPFTSE